MRKRVLTYGSIILLIIFILGALGDEKGAPKDGVPADAEQIAKQVPEQTEKEDTEKSGGKDLTPPPVNPQGKTRPFRMGFTPWPPDLTVEAVNEVYSFIDKHADLVFHHFESIPWKEAYEGTEFSENLMGNWEWRKAKTAKAHEVLLGVSPLNFNRDGLAPSWGTGEGLPLPKGWEGARFNDERVKTAYLNFMKRAIEYFDPDYVSIGSEVNLYAARKPEQWDEYLEFNRYIYTELKKLYPNLTVFSSIQYEWLRGLDDATRGKKDEQVARTKEILGHSDIISLTTYKYGENNNPITNGYFDTVALLGTKPVAISEMGAMSSDTEVFGTTLQASERDQNEFVRFILEYAQANRLLFVNNYIPIDYDELVTKLPKEFKEYEGAARAWMHSGLIDTERNPKPALATWDAYFVLPFSR